MVKVYVIVLLSSFLIMSVHSIKLGGIKDELKPADPKLNDMVQKLKSEINVKFDKPYESLKAISYKEQLVNGTNYFVKVEVDGDKYIHVRIYKPFRGEAILSAVQDNKSHDDEIEYFQE